MAVNQPIHALTFASPERQCWAVCVPDLVSSCSTQRGGFPVSYKTGDFLELKYNFLLLSLNDSKHNGLVVCMKMNNMCWVLTLGEVWMQDTEQDDVFPGAKYILQWRAIMQGWEDNMWSSNVCFMATERANNELTDACALR